MSSEPQTNHASKEELFSHFHRLGIASRTVNHPPVHTVEEALPYWEPLRGIHTKNLLLKDAKDQLWLVSAPIDRAIDLKSLPERIGSKRLSFAKAETLWSALGVRPGAVSPLALINDARNAVRLVLDAAIAEAAMVNYHPLVNTATTSIQVPDLRRFLQAFRHEPQIVSLEGAPAPAS